MGSLLNTNGILLLTLVIVGLSKPKCILNTVNYTTDSYNLTNTKLTNFNPTRNVHCSDIKNKNCSKIDSSSSEDGYLLTTNTLSVSKGNHTSPKNQEYGHIFLKHKRTSGYAMVKTFMKRRIRDVNKPAPAKNPYAVLLLKCSSEDNYCDERSSGTLITLEWVLTSESIIKLANEGDNVIQICAGGSSQREFIYKKHAPGQQVQLSTTFHFNKENHLGLVKAEKKFTETKFVKPIKIAYDEWPYTGPYGGDCKFTGFHKLTFLDGDYERQTLELRGVALGCNCQSKDGHVRKTEYICSGMKSYENFCSIPGGAGLICDDEVRGVLYEVFKANFYEEQCLLNGNLTENCNDLDELDRYKYIETATHLFYDTYPHLQWISSYIPQPTEISNISITITNTTKKSTPMTTTNVMNTSNKDSVHSCKVKCMLVLSSLIFHLI